MLKLTLLSFQQRSGIEQQPSGGDFKDQTWASDQYAKPTEKSAIPQNQALVPKTIQLDNLVYINAVCQCSFLISRD